MKSAKSCFTHSSQRKRSLQGHTVASVTIATVNLSKGQLGGKKDIKYNKREQKVNTKKWEFAVVMGP